MIGKLIFSSNVENDIQPAISPYQVVYLDTQCYENSRIPNAICGTVLLPPYSIMSALVETEDTYPIVMVADQYLSYLHTTEPMSFIVGILALLLKGISVIIYIGSFEAEFTIIPQTIQRFLNLRYGMFPEYMGNGFMFPIDPMYTDQIYSDLFLFDYCDLGYLQRCHSSHPFNNEVNNKIMMMGYMSQPQVPINGGPIDPFRVIGG